MEYTNVHEINIPKAFIVSKPYVVDIDISVALLHSYMKSIGHRHTGFLSRKTIIDYKTVKYGDEYRFRYRLCVRDLLFHNFNWDWKPKWKKERAKRRELLKLKF